MSSDKRAAFRVEEACRLTVESVSADQWDERLALMAGSYSNVLSVRDALEEVNLEISRKLIAVNRVSTTVAGCLDLLNKKLEVMVDHINHLQHERSELGDGPVTRCELSSTGLRFDSAQHYEIGKRLYVQTLLVKHTFFFESLAEVSRVSVNDDGTQRVAVRFRGVRNSDRDALIKHLLYRQSETIRARRLKLDDVQS